MKISNKGLRFIEEVEGKCHSVYLDSGGEPTIGIGHLLTKDERRSGKLIAKDVNESLFIIDYRSTPELSDNEIYAILRYDLISVEQTVNKYVGTPLSQNQYDALVSFAFNVGNTAFRHSTLLRLLNSGQYDEVPNQMRRWKYDNGKVVKGLINRREKEVALWEGRR